MCLPLVERVEILRGAGATRQGSGAVGGSVNLVTRSATDQPVNRVGFSGGSFETWEGSLFRAASRALCLGAVLVLTSVGTAQEEKETKPQDKPKTEQEAEQDTPLAKLRKRIAEVEADEKIEKAIKDEALKAFREAEAKLKRAEEFRTATDKCRKAIKWFEAQGAEFRFHDLRADGLTAAQIGKWQKALGTGTLLNRRSQTWRQIPAERRDNPDAAGEQQLAVEFPTVIQRPVVTAGNTITIGFDEHAWKALV